MSAVTSSCPFLVLIVSSPALTSTTISLAALREADGADSEEAEEEAEEDDDEGCC